MKALNLLEDKLTNPIGSSKTTSNFAPAWSLKIINGEIIFEENLSTYYKKIFNIADINYTLSLVDDTYTTKKAVNNWNIFKGNQRT